MEAISVLENRQEYREANVERHTLGEDLTRPASKIELLEKLTLTLLQEIESLKDIRQFQVRDDERHLSLHEQVRRFEIKLMSHALKHTGGHQARAAQLLGINATTLHSKMKRYHIHQKWLGEQEDARGAFDVETGEDNS